MTNMKKLLLCLVMLICSVRMMAQCGNNNTLWQSVTPACPSTQVVTNCIFGGEYELVCVSAGNTYTFSTCGSSWDTQITLYDNAGGAALGYNDDGCGLQSTITWFATFTGQLRVLVDQYNCASNASCASLTVTCVGNVQCIVPPPPPETDCIGAITICNGQNINNTSTSTGNVADLTSSNYGCLTSAERQGTWYVFSPSVGGQIGFTIDPVGPDDYDFAIWGPFPDGSITSAICPPLGPPIRCSFASGPSTFSSTLSYNTGIGSPTYSPPQWDSPFTSYSEPSSGDGWVSGLNASLGEVYLLYISNFDQTGLAFSLSWNLQGGASLDCTVLPIELISFDGHHESNGNKLYWSTATEQENDHFSLERSTDLIDWKLIGTVQGGGTTQEVMSYSFLDEDYEHTLNYYRLEQTDINGSHEYVGPVVVIDNSREEYKVVRRLNYVGQEVDEFYHGFFIEHRDHGKPVMRFQ